MKLLHIYVLSILASSSLYGMDYPIESDYDLPTYSEIESNTIPEPPAIVSYTECCINETTGEAYRLEYTNDGVNETTSLYHVYGNDQSLDPETSSEVAPERDNWNIHDSYADSVADSNMMDPEHEKQQRQEDARNSNPYQSSLTEGDDKTPSTRKNTVIKLYTTTPCSSIMQQRLASPEVRAGLQHIKQNLESKIWKSSQLHKKVAFITMALDGSLVEKIKLVEEGSCTIAQATYQELREAWPWAHEVSFMQRFVGADDEGIFIKALGTDIINDVERTLIARADYQKAHNIDLSFFIGQCRQKQMRGDFHALASERTRLSKELLSKNVPQNTLHLRCRIVTLHQFMADPITIIFHTIATHVPEVARKQVMDLTQQIGEFYNKNSPQLLSETTADMVDRYGYDLIAQARTCYESRPDYKSDMGCVSSITWEIIVANIAQGPLPLAHRELNHLEQQIQDHCATNHITPDQQHDYLIKEAGFDILAQARSVFESREDYQEASSSSNTHEASSSSSTNDFHMVPVQAAVIDSLNACHNVEALADRLELISRDVFSYATQHKYEVHPEVQDQVELSIGTIRITQDAQTVVFHVSYVERVLTGIQMQTQPQTTPQPTLLERSPELLMRALEKFAAGLNPVTQVKKAVEFWVGTAHFVADVTVGKFYLTAEQYDQRIKGFWSTLEAMSPSNLSQLTAEQWVDMAAQMAADMVYARGIASTIAYLKEIDAVAKAQRKVSCIADKFKKGFDHVIGREPVLITPEGIIWQAPQELQEITVLEMSVKNSKNSAKEVIKDAQGVLNKEKEIVEWARYKSKHAPPPHVPWKDVVKSTKNGVARYKPGINIKDLELHAWYNGQKVKTGKNWKVFKAEEIIGAKWGKETCYMRVECTANTIHGHPIPLAEYLELLK